MSQALDAIAARAGELDRRPRFPSENFVDLAAAGALAPMRHGLGGEVRLVRAVAAADASTARILDGHLNGVERLALAGPEPMRSGSHSPARRLVVASCSSESRSAAGTGWRWRC